MKFELPQLPYANDALAPFIDAKTMEIHHGKHHAGYTNNLNGAIEGTDFAQLSIEDLCKKIDSKTANGIRNNGGGFYNHSLFWTLLHSGKEDNAPQGDLKQAIESSFGNLDAFKSEFIKSSMGRFGSGWSWVIVNSNNKLQITSTPNQDNPLMQVAEVQGTPILGLDLWEHAYYLNYQNRRADYVDAFFKIINWNQVEKLWKKA